MRYNTVRIPLIVILALCVSSCFVYLHENWKTPTYTGFVIDTAGQPVAGAEVYLANYPDNKVETDAEGKFILPPHKEFEMTSVLCPGPCDATPKTLDLVIETPTGQREVTEVHTCLGHPSHQCNGRSEHVNVVLE